MNAKNQMATDRPSGHVRNNGGRLSVVGSDDPTAWGTLIRAVNFYARTSEMVGKGLLVERTGTGLLLIPVRMWSQMDIRDLEKLRSRVSELPSELDVRLEPMEVGPWLDGWWLHVPKTRLDEVSRALLRRPGALGWGSLVDRMVSYDDEELESAVASHALPILPEPVRAELQRRLARKAMREQE